MRTPLELESTLTDRYQTTVPATVRRALKLGKRDKLKYAIRADGEVVLSRAGAQEQDDPALLEFLKFLADDITRSPQHLKPVDKALVKRARALTAKIRIHLDERLSPEDE